MTVFWPSPPCQPRIGTLRDESEYLFILAGLNQAEEILRFVPRVANMLWQGGEGHKTAMSSNAIKITFPNDNSWHPGVSADLRLQIQHIAENVSFLVVHGGRFFGLMLLFVIASVYFRVRAWLSWLGLCACIYNVIVLVRCVWKIVFYSLFFVFN